MDIMKDIMVPCWQCSYGDSVSRIALKDFKDHNDECHGDCTHKCQVCPNVFSTFEDMDQHIKEDHGKFVCTGCFERHGIQRILEWDTFSVHYCDDHKFSKIRCDWCPNRFHHAQHYEEHKDTWHVNVPRTIPVKIKCVNCKDGFSAERDQLELHNAARHNPKRYPFQCSTCGNVFERSADCDEHSENCSIRTYGAP